MELFCEHNCKRFLSANNNNPSRLANPARHVVIDGMFSYESLFAFWHFVVCGQAQLIMLAERSAGHWREGFAAEVMFLFLTAGQVPHRFAQRFFINEIEFGCSIELICDIVGAKRRCMDFLTSVNAWLPAFIGVADDRAV